MEEVLEEDKVKEESKLRGESSTADYISGKGEYLYSLLLSVLVLALSFSLADKNILYSFLILVLFSFLVDKTLVVGPQEKDKKDTLADSIKMNEFAKPETIERDTVDGTNSSELGAPPAYAVACSSRNQDICHKLDEQIIKIQNTDKPEKNILCPNKEDSGNQDDSVVENLEDPDIVEGNNMLKEPAKTEEEETNSSEIETFKSVSERGLDKKEPCQRLNKESGIGNILSDELSIQGTKESKITLDDESENFKLDENDDGTANVNTPLEIMKKKEDEEGNLTRYLKSRKSSEQELTERLANLKNVGESNTLAHDSDPESVHAEFMLTNTEKEVERNFLEEDFLRAQRIAQSMTSIDPEKPEVIIQSKSEVIMQSREGDQSSELEDELAESNTENHVLESFCEDTKCNVAQEIPSESLDQTQNDSSEMPSNSYVLDSTCDHLLTSQTPNVIGSTYKSIQFENMDLDEELANEFDVEESEDSESEINELNGSGSQEPDVTLTNAIASSCDTGMEAHRSNVFPTTGNISLHDVHVVTESESFHVEEQGQMKYQNNPTGLQIFEQSYHSRQNKNTGGSDPYDYSDLYALFKSILVRVKIGRQGTRPEKFHNAESPPLDDSFSSKRFVHIYTTDVEVTKIRSVDKSQALASKVAKGIFLSRQRKAVDKHCVGERLGSEIAEHGWDALFALFLDDAIENSSASDAADMGFVSRLSDQINKNGSINGELVRQYLNTVLRGLPPSKTLSGRIKNIPSQDIALSHTSSPDCAFGLGKINVAFRRIFLSYYSESLFQQVANDQELCEKLVDDAMNDLYSFQRTMEKFIFNKYSLLNTTVKDIVGDTYQGRIQDSRRGGELSKTEDPVVLVQSCVEDAVLDPLLDTICLLNLSLCGQEDRLILKACSVDKKKWKFSSDLENVVEIEAALDSVAKMWQARTTSSKLKHLLDSMSYIMPVHEKDIKKRHVTAFVYLIRLSSPFNMSSQFKFINDTLTDKHMNAQGRVALALLGTAKLLLLKIGYQEIEKDTPY